MTKVACEFAYSLRRDLWTVLWIGVFLTGSEASTGAARTSMAHLSVPPSEQLVGHKEMGLASVYADRHDGYVTASGQIYDKTKLTTAHKRLPYGTRVKVTNPRNKKSVILLVNDRGPVPRARILDISPAAASRLGFSAHGVHEVTLEVVKAGDGKVTKLAHR